MKTNSKTKTNRPVPYKINPAFINTADPSVLSEFNLFLCDFELNDEKRYRGKYLDFLPLVFAYDAYPTRQIYHAIINLHLFCSNYIYWTKTYYEVKNNVMPKSSGINYHNDDRCEKLETMRVYIEESARKFASTAIWINSQLKAKGYPVFLYKWDMKYDKTKKLFVPTDQTCVNAVKEFAALYSKLMGKGIEERNWKKEIIDFQSRFC